MTSWSTTPAQHGDASFTSRDLLSTYSAGVDNGQEPIDWFKTLTFLLWLCLPIILLIGIYVLGVELLAHLIRWEPS